MKAKTKKITKLEDFPGYLSPFETHHADWPAYPEEKGMQFPLFHFSAFPLETRFIEVDDIDGSILFIADMKCSIKDDLFHPRNFHIAAWHEDLLALHNAGFVEGIETVTERKLNELSWVKSSAKIRSDSKLTPGDRLGYKLPDGSFQELSKPDFTKYEDDQDFKRFIHLPTGALTVTSAGRSYIRSEILKTQFKVDEAISPKVAKLFSLGFFDTCIREACVQLEHEIKKIAGSDAWGDKLVDDFILSLKQEKFLESFCRTSRQELRSVFKMIRNDYMPI